MGRVDPDPGGAERFVGLYLLGRYQFLFLGDPWQRSFFRLVERRRLERGLQRRQYVDRHLCSSLDLHEGQSIHEALVSRSNLFRKSLPAATRPSFSVQKTFLKPISDFVRGRMPYEWPLSLRAQIRDVIVEMKVFYSLPEVR